MYSSAILNFFNRSFFTVLVLTFSTSFPSLLLPGFGLLVGFDVTMVDDDEDEVATAVAAVAAAAAASSTTTSSVVFLCCQSGEKAKKRRGNEHAKTTIFLSLARHSPLP